MKLNVSVTILVFLLGLNFTLQLDLRNAENKILKISESSRMNGYSYSSNNALKTIPRLSKPTDHTEQFYIPTAEIKYTYNSILPQSNQHIKYNSLKSQPFNLNTQDTKDTFALTRKVLYPTGYVQESPLSPTLTPTQASKGEAGHVSLLNQLKTLWEFHQAFMIIWHAIVEYNEKSSPSTSIKVMTSKLPMKVNVSSFVEHGDKESATGSKVKRKVKEEPTGISEARYTKNDPLKSYYDFVIIEASHKFWSVFEVITSVIIIYSTFCAIYFSKMNPLVSKHDYTDYIGSEDYQGPPKIKFQPEAGRYVQGEFDEDEDFVDIDDAAEDVKGDEKNWLGWLPNASHSVEFILKAIDKLQMD